MSQIPHIPPEAWLMLFQHLSRRPQSHKQYQQLTPSNGTVTISPNAVDSNTDVEALATAIEAAGMKVPASLALQVGRPLSWIGGQMLWMLQPFVEGLGIGSRRSPFSVPGLAHLLERDGGVDSLVERLEAGTGTAGTQVGGK